ncbi:WYL domain-containing protein [Myroides odoratimimus]|nr:WYL domain-containing protein [Myroides odoratimimus]
MTIDIRPNSEFYIRILSFGANVEVLEPIEIREEMKKRFSENLALYL